MRDLAGRLIPVYQEPDPERYLANLSALQMVAGDYAAAYVSRQELRDRQASRGARPPVGRAVIYDMYAYAKAMEADNGVPFAEGSRRRSMRRCRRLNDQDAYSRSRGGSVPPRGLSGGSARVLDQQRAKDSIDQSDAVKLIWTYLSFDAYRSFGPWWLRSTPRTISRRYTVENDVLDQNSATGRTFPPWWFGPKRLHAAARRCSSSRSTIRRTTRRSAQPTAMSGWWLTRAGSMRILRAVVPYQHDGDDARAVINWIAKQPWSDGRVGNVRRRL